MSRAPQSFRLPTVGKWFASSSAPMGHLDRASWLDGQRLWLEGWLTVERLDSCELWSRMGRLERTSRPIALSYSRPDLHHFPEARGQALVLDLGSAVELGGKLDELRIRVAGSWYRWTRRRGLPIDPDLIDPLSRQLERLDRESSQELIRFLGQQLREEPLDESDDPLLASRRRSFLSRLQPLLHPQATEVMPPYLADPHSPFGCSFDRCLAIDDRSLFLSGWIWDADRIVREMLLVCEDGRSVPFAGKLSRFVEPGTADLFGASFGRAVEGRHGIAVHLEVPGGGVLAPDRRFHLCLQTTVGEKWFRLPAASTDPLEVREQLFGRLPAEQYVDDDLLRKQVIPAVEKLTPRCSSIAQVEEIPVCSPADNPVCSVLVPVTANFGMLEAQLAILSDGTSLPSFEVVYAVDGVSERRSLELLFDGLARLYGIPLRVLHIDRSIGFAAAVNLAAGRAQSDTLVLLHSDVLPVGSGWLRALGAALRSETGRGAVGPTLLYPDGSINSTGVEFELSAGGRTWTAVCVDRGLPEGMIEPSGIRRVAALSGACLCVDRGRWEEVGGLAEDYVVGDFADLDLCLRLAEVGSSCWHLRDVRVHHLEAQSRLRGTGWQRNEWTAAFNRALFSSRWSQQLGFRGLSATRATSSVP